MVFLGKFKGFFAFLVAFSLLLHISSILCLSPSASDIALDIVEYISEGFYGYSSSLDISGYGIYKEELGAIFSSVIKNDPYLFFVESRLSFSFDSSGKVLSLKPAYKLPPSEADIALSFCLGRVKKLSFGSFGGELETALYFHDLICENFEYDESLENDNIYDFLLTGKGTCQAYTGLYMALLRERGIECSFAASDSISHIWNLVNIDGEWFHTDLTWDDSRRGSISHRHFLLSDRLAEERGHKDWYSPENTVCSSERFAEYDFNIFFHSGYVLGDIDHNGRAELYDLLVLSNEIFENACIKCADVSCDGLINEADAALLRRKLLEGN